MGYSLFWASVGILMARIPALWQNIPVLPPFAMVASLLFSGALLDTGSLFPAISKVLGFIPANIYMQVSSGMIASILPLLAVAVVIILLSAIIDQIRKR